MASDPVMGRRMIEERVRLGMTLHAVAGLVGVSVRTVCYWESGRTFARANQLRVLHARGYDVLYVIAGVRSTVV